MDRASDQMLGTRSVQLNTPYVLLFAVLNVSLDGSTPRLLSTMGNESGVGWDYQFGAILSLLSPSRQIVTPASNSATRSSSHLTVLVPPDECCKEQGRAKREREHGKLSKSSSSGSPVSLEMSVLGRWLAS
ncbi:hypothetical protein EST38_g13706 [Candolleomyces aberdarensis]|uniref:Uncharacterized protein n=1 Tax=Candolleomyces aberdarensis TaxID=2316362 RepID=A0A4Q2CZA5_9AGAR|nr:hypothetical protein EST38_g13706 [Candolleomyces aberdarensis]